MKFDFFENRYRLLAVGILFLIIQFILFFNLFNLGSLVSLGVVSYLLFFICREKKLKKSEVDENLNIRNYLDEEGLIS